MKKRAPTHNSYIEWRTPEYPHFEKNSDWFWMLGLVAVIGVVLAIYFHNYLFAVFILLASISIAIFAVRKPETITIKVDARGVYTKEGFHPYNSIDSFWIEHNTNEPVLLLQPKSTIAPYIILPIGDTEANELRNFLGDFLEEEELKIPLSHTLFERLGF